MSGLTPSTAASYLAGTTRARLRSEPPLAAPEVATAPAALLQADIAAFTRNVEELTGSGPDGLDSLAAALDAYFCIFADVVDSYGGDIINVAGDAFTCAFPVGDNTVDETLHRAVTAATRILETVRRSPEASRFESRVGIGVGDLTTAFVGGWKGDWRLVATGDLVTATSAAEQAAHIGSIALTPAAAALAASFADVEATQDGTLLVALRAPVSTVPSAPRVELPFERFDPLVPAPVRARSATDDAAWLAELRTVSVMVAGLSQLDHAQRTPLDIGHESVRAVQATIERYEGLMTMALDNKGVTTLGFFGIPPLAHEDDPVRAVLAAQRVAAELSELGLHFGVGIARGRAFAGAFGNDIRREYTVHGNVVNLAARLMQTAVDEVLVDEATAEAIAAEFDLEQRPAVTLKGRSEAVRPSVPRRRLAHPSVASMPAQRMVGRRRERQVIADHIAGSGRANQTTLYLEGEAGIGKSALIADAIRSADELHATVLVAAAADVERSTSYFGWRPVVAELASPIRLPGFLHEHPEMSRLLPLLADVAPGPATDQLGPDNDLTRQMRGETRAANTRLLLVSMLRDLAASTTTVLVVEDAHWLDDSSWTLLLEVVEQVPDLRTIVASRPPEQSRPEFADRLLDRTSTTRLTLDELDGSDIPALIAGRLGVDSVPSALTDFVQQRTSGNPFFAVEVVQSLVEAGLIRVVDGTCSVGDLDSAELPSTVEGVVVSRLDRLPDDEQLTLKIAAVLGRSFSPQAITDLHPLHHDEAATRASLEHLVAAGLTTRETDQRTQTFSHDIIREVTYGLLPGAQRRPLHLAIVDWYEANADDLDPHVATLADHCIRGDAPDRAVGYLERAGNLALRTGAFNGALGFFETALDLDRSSSVERRANLVTGVGAARYFTGDLAQARTCYEQAVAVLHRPVPDGRLAVGRELVRELAIQVAHLVAPRHFAGRDSARADALDEVVECYRTLGQIYFLDGEPPDRMIHLTLAGLNVGERAGPSGALSRILVNAAVGAGLVNLERLAERYAARATDMARTVDGGEASAYVWSIYSILLSNWGRWDDARAANDRAQQVVLEVGDYNLEAEVWQVRAALELCAGDFGTAQTAWEQTRKLGKRAENPQMVCWSLLDECQMWLGMGRPERATAVLDEALAIPTAPNDGSTKIEKHATTAAVRAHQARHDDAAAEAVATIDMVAEQLPAAYPWPDFAATCVEVLLDIAASGSAYGESNQGELIRQAKRGAKAVRKVSKQFRNVAARGWYLEGRIAEHEGRRDDAIAHHRRAVQVADAADHSYDLARSTVALARLGEPVDLDRAEEILAGLDAGAALAQAREVSDAITGPG